MGRKEEARNGRGRDGEVRRGVGREEKKGKEREGEFPYFVF